MKTRPPGGPLKAPGRGGEQPAAVPPRRASGTAVCTYAVLFRLTNLVVHGSGFSVEVRAEGRAVAELAEKGTWWLEVPATELQGSGENLHEAFLSLRAHFLATLFEIAARVRAPAEFARRARRRFAVGERAAARFGATLRASSPRRRRSLAGDFESRRALVLRVARLGTRRAARPADNQVDALVILDRRSPAGRAYRGAERRARRGASPGISSRGVDRGAS